MQDYQHQIDIFNRFKDNKTAALFMEQGTGKNRIMIQLAEHHWKNQRIQAVVVVTTSALVMNWNMIELPFHSTVPYRTFMWKKHKNIHVSAALYYFIMNIDGTSSYKFPGFWKEFMKTYPRFMLILDESSLAKNHKAARTKAVTYMARKAAVRCIASGTPITKSPLDLYSQTEILAQEHMGFKSYYSFKNRYAEEVVEYNGVRSFKKIIAYKNLGELTTKLGKIAAIITKKECLDLPDKIYERIHTDFTPEQEKVYNDLVNYSIAQIEGSVITAVNGMALINRLLQICSGQIKVDDKYISIKTDRYEAIKDYIEMSETPVVIWSAFVQSSINLATFLGPLALHIPAGQSPTALYSLLQSWKKGDYKGLIANPASLGHGITLVESATVGRISRTFNLEHYLQSEDRTHRIGQTRKVLYTEFITMGSVEERVLDVLREGRSLAEFILNKARLKWIIAGGKEI